MEMTLLALSLGMFVVVTLMLVTVMFLVLVCLSRWMVKVMTWPPRLLLLCVVLAGTL